MMPLLAVRWNDPPPMPKSTGCSVEYTIGRCNVLSAPGLTSRIRAVKITVHKPHAPIAAIFDDVGIMLTRSRHP